MKALQVKTMDKASKNAISRDGTKTDIEHRIKPYRSKPTIEIIRRIDRAIHQRLFLVEIFPPTSCPLYGGPLIQFSVLGSTGNVYKVNISKVPSCTCPDHSRGSNLCKHLLFVMLKIVGLPPDSELVYQSAYLLKELDFILEKLQQRILRLGRDGNSLVNGAVRQRTEDVTNTKVLAGVKRQTIEDRECAICFESLGSDTLALTFCQQVCGTNFHTKCIEMWTKRASQNPTCPVCRQPWIIATKEGASNDGSANELYIDIMEAGERSVREDSSSFDSNRQRSFKRPRNFIIGRRKK